MKTNPRIHFLSPGEIKYTWKGQNLHELRSVKLRKIAASLQLNTDMTKNDLLHAIVGRAKALEKDSELTSE